MPPHRLLVAFVLTAVAVTTPAPPAASDPGGARPTRVRAEAGSEGSLLVHGEYPPVRSSCLEPTQPLLHARYRGAVEVARATDGSLTLIGELPFEEYLKGIAEVPRSWPLEALKAQVVAARSYAAVQLSRSTSEGRALGYDLCATDACQVYLGMGVEAGPWGSRWVRAVEETQGEVLVHGGEPAETFYFSTSNGRTYSNQEVWGSDPLPYLPSVAEADDGESPLSRWRVAIPFDDLAQFLRSGGHWGEGPIRAARADGDALVLRGRDRTRISHEHLRSALNAAAPCQAPDRYPPTEPGGYRLPQTVPSIWFDARVEGRSLVLEGRGWGHGIGMVQWGAKGKADRGLGYGDILSAYYGGLRPQERPGPGTIRVLIAKGLRSLTIVPSGDATLQGLGRAPEAPWRVTPAGRERLRVRRGPAPAPQLAVTELRASASLERTVKVRFHSSHNVRTRIEFLADGEMIGASPWRSRDDGRASLSAEAFEGTEVLRVRATNGVDTVVSDAIEASAAEGDPDAAPEEAPGPSPAPEHPGRPAALPDDEGGTPILPIAGGAVLIVVLALLVLRAGARKRLHHD